MQMNFVDLTNKKVFLTGGTGFIGKNILKYLVDSKINPLRVTILSRNPEKFKLNYPELIQPWLDFVDGDILDLDWSTQEYDYFLHAATSVVEQSHSIKLFDEIIVGTKNALEFAEKAGVKVFINFSSGAVYQPNIGLEGLKEDSPLLNYLQTEKNTYGLAKLAAEHLAYLYSQRSGMKIITLRCFCFAGPYLDAKHFAIGEFIQKALRNEDIVVKAGIGIFRSYLDTNDLIKQLLIVLNYAQIMNKTYDVFNLGSEEAISLPDLAHVVVDVLNSRSPVFTTNTDKQINYYIPAIGKLKSLGVPSYFSLVEIIQRNHPVFRSKW